MSMEKTIQFNCSPDEIKEIIIAGLREFEAERASKSDSQKTYSINQARKRLNLSHSTLTKYIKQGRLRVVAGNRVTVAAMNDFLSSK
jgi:hypothetical protein